jgi:hypothetical protein
MVISKIEAEASWQIKQSASCGAATLLDGMGSERGKVGGVICLNISLPRAKTSESRKQARGKGMTLDLDQWFNSSVTLSLVTGSRHRSIGNDISSLERKNFDSKGSLSVVTCLRYVHSNDDISWWRSSICH